MPELLVCAPLTVEAAALRRSAVRDRVVRTGYGAERSARAAASLRDRDPAAVAVAGLAAGVGPAVRSGDVVVASELIGPVDRLRCPGAPLLAAALRRRGLRVHVGPVATVAELVRGPAYDALAGQGALAVDLESAVLAGPLAGAMAGAGPGRPLAVARVVVDTRDAPLLRPGTVFRGVAALRRLTAVGDALADWAAAVRPRRVLLAAPRSFCAGVDRAIDIVEAAVARHGAPVYVRKQIVHNVHVVRSLEEQGAIFVDELDEVPDGATVVFSAHGVAPAVRDDAARRALPVIDATCPLVAKVHTEARRFARRGDTIVLVGHAGHEETEGTLGEVPEQTVLVETADDVDRLRVDDPARVSYLMQTTLSTDEAASVVEALRHRFPAISGPASEDICYATTNRQQALRAVARETDVVLVVGSANSSNSLRLVETAQREGVPAYRVDAPDDIDPSWLTAADSVGITAGASAPPALVDDVVEALRGLGPVDVAEHRTTTENVRFTLPKEVS